MTKVVAPEMSVDSLALSRLCEDGARRKIATAQPAGRAPVAKGNFSQLTVVIFCGCYFGRYHSDGGQGSFAQGSAGMTFPSS